MCAGILGKNGVVVGETVGRGVCVGWRVGGTSNAIIKLN